MSTAEVESELELELESPLGFSDAAAVKVRGVRMVDEGSDNLMLRVFVSGGGCSGFQYGFTFDDAVGDGDTVVENGGVRLLIDPMSVQYLTGADRLHRGPGRGAVRYQEPQCHDDLRLRVFVFGLSDKGNPGSRRRARCATPCDIPCNVAHVTFGHVTFG